jgi:hypothetical protein
MNIFGISYKNAASIININSLKSDRKNYNQWKNKK